MNVTIYAAGPIDLGTDIPNWREQLQQRLDKKSISGVIFDPSTAYKTSRWGHVDNARSTYIEQVNRKALDDAKYFVVCLPKGVSSVGTPIELDWAFAAAKELLLITDIAPGKSVYLDNRVSIDTWFWGADLKSESCVSSLLDRIVTFIYTAENIGGQKAGT